MMAFMVFHVACNVLDVSVRHDGEIQYVPCKLTTRRRRQETPTEGMIFSWIHFLHHKNLQFEQCRVYSILYFIFIIIIRFVKKMIESPVLRSSFFSIIFLSLFFFFFVLLVYPPRSEGDENQLQNAPSPLKNRVAVVYGVSLMFRFQRLSFYHIEECMRTPLGWFLVLVFRLHFFPQFNDRSIFFDFPES